MAKKKKKKAAQELTVTVNLKDSGQRNDVNRRCTDLARHRHPSFGFNTRTGYGYCWVCGSMLAKELVALIILDTN